jgi:glycosyltransferase involved in cell wall biosynthesis
VSQSPRRLRIAYVYDALYPYLHGGAERRFAELARRLAARHEVHSVSWQFWEGPARRTEEGVVLHGVGTPPSLYGDDGKRTVREALSFAARLPGVLLRERFDVIDCAATPYLPLYTAWLAAGVSRTPLVATWHEFWGDHWGEYLDHRGAVARVARAVEAGAVRLGGLQVAVSPFTAERLVGAGLPPDRVRVVGNGLPASAFTETQRSPITSHVVFVGRLIDEKRVDLLVGAVARLVPAMPDLRCLVIGDGPERAALETQASAAGVGEQVRFLGHVSEADKIALMKASQVLVLPSIREGFGIAAIEGQAAGLAPVVVRSPHSAAASLVRDGVDGVVCDPDAGALAAALRSLLENPGRLARMQMLAQQAAAGWDWDRVAVEMESVYLDAAGPEPAGARVRKLSWR